jgi:lysophospholipase L1-like esterase
MSNTTQEFSAFKPLADREAGKDPRLVIVDGAQGGQTAALWSNPACACWGVLDTRLAAAGVSAAQVSVVWVKQADAGPTSGWPAYAQQLKNEIETILRLLKQRFPNLQIAYLSSRIYAGYATSALNPEPYAYESAFSVRGVIQDQLAGGAGLDYRSGQAPWVAWGPYLWADGTRPRSDGLTWACSDLSSSDGTHPSVSGQQKVAALLLDFVRADPTAREWFLQ